MNNFFTIEGPNGAGKTRIIRSLSRIFYQNEDLLKSVGYQTEDLIITREPFGVYRDFLQERKKFSCPLEKLFFMMASRAYHFEKIIWPNLCKNKIIICDRFYQSSLVHHVLIDKINSDFVRDLHLKITNHHSPKRVFFIDSPNIEKNLLDKGEEIDIDQINDERYFFRKLFKDFHYKASFFNNNSVDDDVENIAKAIFRIILTDIRN